MKGDVKMVIDLGFMLRKSTCTLDTVSKLNHLVVCVGDDVEELGFGTMSDEPNKIFYNDGDSILELKLSVELLETLLMKINFKNYTKILKHIFITGIK